MSCIVACVKQTANIPAKRLRGLVGMDGTEYLVPENLYRFFECGNSKNNLLACETIRNLILQAVNCIPYDLDVRWENVSGQRYCLLLTIANSPIIFNYISFHGGLNYPFDRSACRQPEKPK